MDGTEEINDVRGRPRDAAVDEAVLAAARLLLAERGHAGLTMEGVAQRAGVAKASVYRRWAGKGELLIDLYMDGMPAEPLVARKATVLDDLKSYLDQTVRRLQDKEWVAILRSLVAEAQSKPRTAELLKTKVIEVRRNAGRQLLKIGKERGEIRADLDDELFLDFLFGAIWYRVLLGHAAVDRDFANRAMRMATKLAVPDRGA